MTHRFLVTLILAVALLLALVGCRQDAPAPHRSEPVSRARITADGAGLFTVDSRALASLGWTADEPLSLSLNGQQLPYQSHDGALYFYLTDTLPTRYSSRHNLWLTRGSGEQAMTTLVGDEARGGTVTAQQKLTGREQYSPTHVGDPWFWRTLVASTSEMEQLETPGRRAGTVAVMVRAAGVTQTQHEIVITVDGREAGRVAWHGHDRHEDTLSLDLPAGETLQIEFAVPEREGAVDISMLDEVIISYPSTPRLIDGAFYGSAGAEGVAHFEGLGVDAIAWQLEPAVAPLPVQPAPDGAFVYLPASQTVVVMERRQARVAEVEPAEEVALSTEGADYLAIVAPPLLEAIEPLMEFHRAAGMSVMVVTPQQAYDQFTHGAVDPLAFQALLVDAHENWQTKPRFVLLAGDTTYDPAGYQAAVPETYLPSPFVETVFGGETVSDNVIADLNDDGYPDLALGRLPARTAEQLSAIIQKIVAYSNSPAGGEWRHRVLLAADGQEPLFKTQSEQLRQHLPDALETLTLYPAAQSEAMTEMIPALNEGGFLVNYVGHGSVQQWGRDQLLTSQAAGELVNGDRLPIFIQMTCLTGLFSHPTQESLAEALLWAPHGGAIAAVAPSSLTLPTNQSRLNDVLLQELLSPERPPIGEALMRAKQSIPLTTANDHDIVATFNLLGDPALRPAPLLLEVGD
jgi:hypothetical protein